MALKEPQQIWEAIKRSERILLCLPSGAGIDGYATSLALAQILENAGIKNDIAAVEGPTPKPLHFLKKHHRVRSEPEHLRQFIIEVAAETTKVHELSYEMKNDRLLIYLSPKNGIWKPEDIRFAHSGYRYDLIISIGAADLESFARFYKQEPNFFYQTPVINIDHSPENEHFGQMNLVDLTASSCAEVVHNLLSDIDPNMVTQDVATALLTGMIAKTKSFKQPNINPQTLQTASHLMANGADRDTIVKSLYRTRSVETLRLWGRALARLKSDQEIPLVWSLLSKQDFIHAGAEAKDLPDVIDELIASSPDTQVIALLYETAENEVEVLVHAEKPVSALQLLQGHDPKGNRQEAYAKLKNTPLVEAERDIISSIRNTWQKQNQS